MITQTFLSACFTGIFHFYTHWKNQRTRDLLTFSGGIKIFIKHLWNIDVKWVNSLSVNISFQPPHCYSWGFPQPFTYSSSKISYKRYFKIFDREQYNVALNFNVLNKHLPLNQVKQAKYIRTCVHFQSTWQKDCYLTKASKKHLRTIQYHKTKSKIHPCICIWAFIVWSSLSSPLLSLTLSLW